MNDPRSPGISAVECFIAGLALIIVASAFAAAWATRASAAECRQMIEEVAP